MGEEEEEMGILGQMCKREMTWKIAEVGRKIRVEETYGKQTKMTDTSHSQNIG